MAGACDRATQGMRSFRYLPNGALRPQLCKVSSWGAESVRACMPLYRLHDTNADDLGLVGHPAPNVVPGDVVILDERRDALVTARVDMPKGHPVTAMLEVIVGDSVEWRWN